MTYIALLRAINVGGHQPVAMSDLRNLLSELGLQDPRSILQSGNLVFSDGRQASSALERLLEKEAARRFGLHTDFLVRTAAEWNSLIAHNPFRAEAERAPARLVVMFLKTTPDPHTFDAITSAITGPEILRGDGRHAYVVYPNGIGRSRLTNALIERKLGTRATARNWNTVMRLAAAAAI